jgi:hypothetical protein
MADKKIHQFAVPTDAQAKTHTFLWVFGDPVTGLLYKPTGSQVAKSFSTYKTKYTAVGDEDVTITIAALSEMEILALYREGQVLYEVDEDPDESEFVFDGTDITLGLAVNNAGERFLILYKNPE